MIAAVARPRDPITSSTRPDISAAVTAAATVCDQGTIDPVAGYTVPVAGGNFCGVTWAWGSTMSIEGPAYDLEAYDDTTFFAIDSAGNIDPVGLEDWDVVSGTYSGLGPYGVEEFLYRFFR